MAATSWNHLQSSCNTSDVNAIQASRAIPPTNISSIHNAPTIHPIGSALATVIGVLRDGFGIGIGPANSINGELVWIVGLEETPVYSTSA